MEESIEDTHYVCAKHLRELGGKAPCCECSGGKDCSFIGTEDDLKEEKDTSLEERLMDKFCVMFERANRDGDAWEIELEIFIKQVIRQEREEAYKEGLNESIESMQKTDEKWKTLIWCIRQDGREALLKEIIDLSEKIEMEGDDGGVGQWKAFKHLRNTLRDKL